MSGSRTDGDTAERGVGTAAAVPATCGPDPRVGSPPSSSSSTETPIWGKYMRTAQWILALVALSLAASEDGWSGLPPFRYLLAVTVMTLVFILGGGMLEWTSRARHVALSINIAFDIVWVLICGSAGTSAAAALALRNQLHMACTRNNDCGKLKAATSLVFGLALLSGMSLLYEVLLWRAGHSGLEPDSAIICALESIQEKKKAAVRIVRPTGANAPTLSGGTEGMRTAGRRGANTNGERSNRGVRVEAGRERLRSGSGNGIGSDIGNGGSFGDRLATALRAAVGTVRGGKGRSKRTAAAAAPAGPDGMNAAAGGGAAAEIPPTRLPATAGDVDAQPAAAAAAPPPSPQPPWMAALDEVDLPGMYGACAGGGGGVLAQAGRVTSSFQVRETVWLARYFLVVRVVQATLAVGSLASMTCLSRYTGTTAYALLVAAQAMGLAVAVVLGAWQALRAAAAAADKVPVGPGVYSSTALSGTKAYFISCATLDVLIWLLIGASATAAAAVSTLPCARVTYSSGAAVYGIVHAGCSSQDRAAVALGLISAPVWLLAAAMSLAAAHEGSRALDLLRRQQAQRREAYVLTSSASASPSVKAAGGGGGNSGGGGSGQRASRSCGDAGGSNRSSAPMYGNGDDDDDGGSYPVIGPRQGPGSGCPRAPAGWTSTSDGGEAGGGADAAASRGVSGGLKGGWAGIRKAHVANNTPEFRRGDGGDVEWGEDEGVEVRQERGEIRHPRSSVAVFTVG